MSSEEELLINAHKGERVVLGLKRPNGVYFCDYVLKAATATHLFVIGARGEEAILLSEIVKIEFQKQPTSAAGRSV